MLGEKIIMSTALITGASRGLGKELSTKFAEGKYNLILNSKSNALFDYSLYGVTQIDITGDITNDVIVCKFESAVNNLGLDVLINNVGIYSNKEFDDTGIDEFYKIIDVNLMASVWLTKIAWSIFCKQKSGLIININSKAGKCNGNHEVAYSMSKHGMKGFFDSLQYEATKYNIRIVNIYPGAINTDMTAHRTDQDKLIKVKDIADFIYKICAMDYKSMRITDIDIERRIY